MNEEQIRKDFEEWMGDGGLSPRAIERNSKGDYILMQAASAWHVWKAVYAHYAKPAAPVELPEPVMAQVRFKPENDTAWSRWKVCAVEDAREIEAYTLVNGWDYEVRYLYTEQQVHALLATPNNLPAQAVEKSATHGMSLHQRILHVGGRENAQTYIEFGSVAAVRALVDQVLRDLPDGAQGFSMPAPPPQADALDAKRWVSESDSKPLESDGEVFVRFSDGTFGIGWASYWHGASNDFAQWSHPDPDEDRTVTHWMKPPTIYTAAPAKENK